MLEMLKSHRKCQKSYFCSEIESFPGEDGKLSFAFGQLLFESFCRVALVRLFCLFCRVAPLLLTLTTSCLFRQQWRGWMSHWGRHCRSMSGEEELKVNINMDKATTISFVSGWVWYLCLENFILHLTCFTFGVRFGLVQNLLQTLVSI